MDIDEAAWSSDRQPAGLDGLARGLANGSVSRRRALKIGAAGAIAGVAGSLGIGSSAAARKKPKRCRKCMGPTSCNPSGCGSPRGGEDYCACVEDVNGKKCCVGAICHGKRCSNNGDCKNDEMCSKEATRFCCENLEGPKGICLKRCGKPI